MNIGDIIGIIFVVAFFIGLAVLAIISDGEAPKPYEEDEHLMDWHRRNGQWQVRYPDGKLSQPLTRGVAEDYRDLFGGTVIPKNRN